MTALRGVLDANMVIGLVKGGVFGLLPSLYAPLFIPTRVKQEILTGQGRPGEAELARALGAWITEIAPDLQGLPPVSASLSMADREALAVAADPVPACPPVPPPRYNSRNGDLLTMEKRKTNRVAWGLATILAVMVLAGIASLSAHYIIVLPRMLWGVGPVTYEEGFVGAPLPTWRVIEVDYRLGLLAVRVPVTNPQPPASIRRRTGRRWSGR